MMHNGPRPHLRCKQHTKVEGHRVRLDFYADWYVSCKELERYTNTEPAVTAVLANALLLRAGGDGRGVRGRPCPRIDIVPIANRTTFIDPYPDGPGFRLVSPLSIIQSVTC